MKKVTIILLLIISFTISANAQVNFGVRAGANLADYTNINSDTRTDFYLGLMLSIKTGKIYTLQPEMTYSKQGTELKGAYTNTIKADYFSVGVMNKFYVADKFHFVIGPFFDICMDESSDFVVNDDIYYDDSFVSAIDLGLKFGAGFDVTNNLTIEARVKQGFFNSFSADGYFDLDDDNSKTRVYQFGLSYRFEFSNN
jgi:hypothetical protein